MLDGAENQAGSPPADRDTAPRPVEFRGAGFTPRAGGTSGWIALALVIGFWQWAGSAGWVNPLFLPAPSAIAGAIYKLAISGALWHHLSWSIMRIGTGWILGTMAGGIIAFAGRRPTLSRGPPLPFHPPLSPPPNLSPPP